MSGTGPYANSSAQLGMAIEPTRGTPAVAPVYWIPVKAPKIQPQLTVVPNDSIIGSMVTVIDQIITARHDELTFTCFAYVDTLAALVRGLLGGVDTIVGTASPYAHTISLLNNDALNGNQPPSYTFFVADGMGLRTLAAGQVDELVFKYTATGLVEVTVKVLAMPYVFNSSVPASAFTTVAAAPSWSCVASLNSVTTMPIVDGTLSFKRGVKFPTALGSIAPYRLFAGPLDCSGSNLTVINAADVEQNLILAGTAFPLSLTFSPPTSPGLSFKFQMSTVKGSQTHQEQGGDGFVITQMDLLPLPNSTDSGSGGLSPVKATFLTAQVGTY
jgi:Phage tail tube protein